MVTRAQRTATALVIGICLLILLAGVWSDRGWMRPATYGKPSGPHSHGPMNATLGFGEVWVLTEDDTTWRVQGLRKAAELVGLQLTVPPLRRFTDDEVRAHLAGAEVRNGFNYDHIRLTMNYISLFERFSETDLDTLLILEDDADFGVHIKSQLVALSEALSNGCQGSHTFEGQESNSFGCDDHGSYDHESWDILWLGHIGIEFTAATHITEYDDPNALPWTMLTSIFNNYYETLRDTRDPSRQRIVYAAAPMASYGLAVTRDFAQVMAQRIRAEHSQFIDEAIHVPCKALEYRCVAPVPNLIHHHHVVGQKMLLSNGSDEVQDLAWWRDRHKYTYNVEWSARCNAMQVGEQVAGRYQCLPGRYDELF